MNIKGVISTLTIATVLMVNGCSAQATNQQAKLYSGRDGAGQFITLTEQYAPDLRNQLFDNTANSACVTGVWLFYDNANYNPARGTMEYVFGPNNYCINFSNLGGRLTAAKFSGWPKDYKANTLTLYQGDYFQGAEEYTHVDLPNLNLDRAAASLIVTGLSPWTVYALPNYGGDKVCVYPPNSNNYTPAFVYDLNRINIPINSIRSVRLGCQGKKKVEATAFQADTLVGVSFERDNSTVHGSNNV